MFETNTRNITGAQVASVANALGATPAGPGRWYGACPAHNASNIQQLAVFAARGRVVLRCQANCSASVILGAIGLTTEALFPPGTGMTEEQRQQVRTARRRREIEEVALTVIRTLRCEGLL